MDQAPDRLVFPDVMAGAELLRIAEKPPDSLVVLPAHTSQTTAKDLRLHVV